MTLERFRPLIDLLEKRLGLKPDLIPRHVWHDVFHKRMIKCSLHRYEDYTKLLRESAEEMQEVVELIVNPESWFFRDHGIFDYLTLLFKQRKFLTSPVKILSLACSTGEEPYSIAMALLDAGVSKNDFTIDAVDISHVALNKAKTGIYRKNSFRGKDLSYRERFFTKTQSGHAISQTVKEKVNFSYANLLSGTLLGFAPHSFQVILCRNLLIYLDLSSQRRVLDLIQTFLSTDGILFVGPAETQIAYLSGFVPIKFPSIYAFQNKESEQHHQNTLFQMPIMDEVSRQFVKQEKMEGIARQDAAVNQENLEDGKSLIQLALQEADKGNFDDSLQACLSYIKQFGASPEVYYLLGLIDQAMGREDKAEDCFRRTIYLQPSHYEALVCLALICESKGELNQADLFRKRAMKSL